MVGSAKSSSGHRKKRQRPPSEAPPSPRADSPPAPKRHRTGFEQDEDVSTSPDVDADETRQTPLLDEDEDDNKENVVEVRFATKRLNPPNRKRVQIRLSSRDNYAIPGESASCVNVQHSSPRIKRESSPEPRRRSSKRVKREPSLPPARETPRPIKREPSPLPSMLPPPPTGRKPSHSPVIKTEPSSPPRRLRPARVGRELLSPSRRSSPPAVEEESSPSVPPHVKREPSQGDTLTLAPHSPEKDVKREAQDPEEETWDEEEETLVEVGVELPYKALRAGQLKYTLDSREFQKSTYCVWPSTCESVGWG